MPKISFVKSRPSFDVESGALLMPTLLAQGLPVASSCHGEGVCSKCRIKIVTGAENLSPETDLERTLRKRNRVDDGLRISCQTRVLGDVTADTDYW